MNTNVKAGRFYKYSNPNLLDSLQNDIATGTLVQVVNLPGCPEANTMGFCHIQDGEGRFLGLVRTSSLEKCKQPKPDNSLATRSEISRFVSLATGGPINAYSDETAEIKREFARLGQKVARLIAHKMELPAGSFEIRYNPGGIAVCGDVTLHGESIYIDLSQSSTQLGFYFRHCDGRKDYCGRRNNWMKFEQLRHNLNWAIHAFQQVAAPLFVVV